MNILEHIKSSVDRYHADVVAAYEHLHANPELSYVEFETSAYVQSQLKQMNIDFRKDIAGTGVLGVIKGRSGGRTIALRADMDALPIKEENNVPFKSKRDMAMHACGHDAHTASLLGVARILQEFRQELEGTVLLIFQPGEEKHPGGARLMLENGVFDEYQPDAIIAQHAYIDYKAGEVGFEPGIIMAAADEIHFRIKGKGGHGALPHLVNDTVLAASQCIVSLQQIVSRRNNPFNPVVLSFGKFLAYGETNVIPDVVTVSGTLRTMNEEERVRLKELIRQTIQHTALAHGCESEVDILDGYPCVVNDKALTVKAKKIAEEYLGDRRVMGLVQRMTAEDFGFFSQRYPSTFYRFGVQGNNHSGGLHTSTFLIDPESLKTSVGVMSYLAYQLVNE